MRLDFLSMLDGGGIFVAECSFHDRAIPKEAGFRWDPAARRWWSSDARVAATLAKYSATPAAREALARAGERSLAAALESAATDAKLDIPTPPGLALLPYQRAGVAYALKRPATLIADEMGLGKTVQAIGVANCVEDLRRVLIVCPASLRLNWQREWTKWTTHRARPVVVTDTWHASIGGSDLMLPIDGLVVVVVSYDGLRKHKKQIDVVSWDLLILDEVHQCNNLQTVRTRQVFGYQKQGHKDYHRPLTARRRLALTGTPITNRAADLWPLVKSYDPTGLGAKRDDFWHRYVYPVMAPANLAGRDASDYIRNTEAHRLRELHDRLRASIMVRRLKADVLTELPPKRRQMVLLDSPAAAALVGKEQRFLARKRAELEALRVEGAVAKLAHWKGCLFEETSRIRHESAVAKIPAAIEHIYEVLENVNKVVVFAHHHDVIDALMHALPAAIKLDGRMAPQDRQAAVDRFQADPKIRVFVGSIKAAGVGLTLTAASVVLFVELDWTPAAMVQAEDRLHRIGQMSSVLVHHLVIDGSIDQRMSQVLIAKADIIGQVLDGTTPADDGSVIDSVLK